MTRGEEGRRREIAKDAPGTRNAKACETMLMLAKHTNVLFEERIRSDELKQLANINGPLKKKGQSGIPRPYLSTKMNESNASREGLSFCHIPFNLESGGTSLRETKVGT